MLFVNLPIPQIRRKSTCPFLSYSANKPRLRSKYNTIYTNLSIYV